MTNRPNQLEFDRIAYTLRTQSTPISWANIALAIGVSGESVARASAQRHQIRHNLPALTIPSARRSNAGRAVALGRWNSSIPTSSAWTFGVEIEFQKTSRLAVAEELERVFGRHIHLYPYHAHENSRNGGCVICSFPSSGYSDWKVETDGSVSQNTHTPTGHGGEVVSPVLTIDRIAEIDIVVKAIKAVGGKATVKCGLHVHIGVAHLTHGQRASIVAQWEQAQHAVKNFVSPSRRYTVGSWSGRSNGYWCKDTGSTEVQQIIQVLSDTTLLPKTKELKDKLSRVTEKYRGLNVLPLAKIGTFEVRLHQGTLSATKIKAWVELLIAFFEFASTVHTSSLALTTEPDYFLKTLEEKASLKSVVVKRYTKSAEAFSQRSH